MISGPADSSDQLLLPLPGSLFLIVPVASALVMETVCDASSHSRALLILTFTVSPLSFTESSMMLIRDRGFSLNGVPLYVGVGGHTAAKALRWFRSR